MSTSEETTGQMSTANDIEKCSNNGISHPMETHGIEVMSIRKIIFLICLLVFIDQIIKIVIYSFFMEVKFEIIPSLFEFKPFFNVKHSYVNNLLYKYFNVNLGLLLHVGLYLFILIIFIPSLWLTFRNNIHENKKLLDVAFSFMIAATICAISGNVIWQKGTLDYIYLKPLFIFDLKDLYSNCFTILLLFYVFKNRAQLKKIKKIKNVFFYIKEHLRKQNKLHQSH